MALLNLRPVRLLDGSTSGGVQLILFRPEDFGRTALLLPELISQARLWQKELPPAGSLAVELSAAGQGGGAQVRVLTGVLLRLKLPKDCSAAEVDAQCRALGAKAAEWLIKQNVQCDVAVANDRESLVNLYPDSVPTQLYCFSKEIRAARTKDGVLYCPASLCAAAVSWTGTDALGTIKAGEGISLHILLDAPDQAEEHAAAEKALALTVPDSVCASALRELLEAKHACRVLFTAWGAADRDAKELVQTTQRILQSAGIFLSVRPVKGAGAAQLSQLVFDPWALYGWYKRQMGLRLAFMAFTLTDEELLQITQPEGKQEQKEDGEKPVPPSGEKQEEEIRRCIEKIGDDVLSSLLEKLDSVLPKGELLSAASDMLSRLDGLSRQSGQLSGQIERLDAIIQAQEAVYLRRMDVVESNLKETVENAAQSILSQLQTNLERVMDEIAALPASIQGAQEAADRLTEALPQTFDTSLTPEELQALGVESTDGLLEKGMTEQEIRLLSTALSLARAGIHQGEQESLFMPFAVPLGFLYELMVRNSFDRQVTPFDVQIQTAEYEKWQQNNPGRTRRFPSARKEEMDLSFYDYISYDRVTEGYFKHVYLDEKPLSDAREWNSWFACFKCIRAIRNKVHPACGQVEKQELINLYNLMVLPGAEHKCNAIHYLNEINAQGARDSSLLIRYIAGQYKQGRPEELERYINQFGAKTMKESMIQFLLRFRACAAWKEFETDAQRTFP